MKKLFGLILSLFVSTTIFGQIFYNDLAATEYSYWKDNSVLHFTIDEHYYVLSYEPNFIGLYEGTKRNVYLYCRDTTHSIDIPAGRWKRVSDAVLENYYDDSKNYQDVDFYTYDVNRHNTSNSSVKVLDKYGRDVVFTLDIHKMVNGGMNITQQTIHLKLKWNTLDGNYYTVVK